MTDESLTKKQLAESILDLLRIIRPDDTDLPQSVRDIGYRALALAMRAELDILHGSVDVATCTWTVDATSDGDIYDGACGVKWEFIEGGPEDNGASFCPRCGGRIVMHTAESDSR